ncbi:16S rRNA (guanine(527)-N(7))-methyltransferase RsmG [Pseudaquabacterium pictum]|uniref:Ribosomal RNA small subunit methyltransferase G n=1 Tax=Pseudaquabacterium pictum TaxID=2315236 RepID=A0A480AX94_9BURK|nr:16S rRNA (guanine(527)-N(7))-methyltransferase RsmG [Rubrivivax pictus]GCL64832.1 ribosomal RNA small subunit methyltransferase G [Rubrivivax pictus]
MAALPAQADRQAALLAAAQALALPLEAAQADLLLAYMDLLQRWNKVYNLTALRDPAEMLGHHLIDCMAVLPPLQRWAAAAKPPSHRLLDVGSGGGLPGVVLAALQPGWQVDCIDTVVKKVSFIRQVAAELRLLNLQGLHSRVEVLQPPPEGYAVVTSRAFASLADFTTLTRHLLAEGGVWMAMKGKLPAEEQAALPTDVEVFHVEQLQVPGLDAQRCLVWMRPR